MPLYITVESAHSPFIDSLSRHVLRGEETWRCDLLDHSNNCFWRARLYIVLEYVTYVPYLQKGLQPLAKQNWRRPMQQDLAS